MDEEIVLVDGQEPQAPPEIVNEPKPRKKRAASKQEDPIDYSPLSSAQKRAKTEDAEDEFKEMRNRVVDSLTITSVIPAANKDQ